MMLETAVAMMRDKVDAKDEITEINAHFEPGIPASEYEVEVWPARGDPVNGKQPKWVLFRRKPRGR